MGHEIVPASSRSNFLVTLVRRISGGRDDSRQQPQKFTADKLLEAGNLSTLASYYSGEPGSLVDLDGAQLMTMYTTLTTQQGIPAAQDFARMILDMPSLAAVNVINAVRTLERNNWVHDAEKTEESQKGPRPIDLNDLEDPEEMAVGGLGTFMAMLRPQKDETEEIKDQFRRELEQAGIVIKSRVVDSEGQSRAITKAPK